MWAYKEVKMIHWCLRQPETSPIQSPSGSSVLCVVWASGDFLYKLLEQFQTLEKTLNRHSRKIHALSRRKIKPMKLHLWELWVWAEYLSGCENRGWARRLTGHWVLAISPILCWSWTMMLGKCPSISFPHPPTLSLRRGSPSNCAYFFPKFLLSTTASFMAVIKLTVIREGDVWLSSLWAQPSRLRQLGGLSESRGHQLVLRTSSGWHLTQRKRRILGLLWWSSG